MLDKANSDFVNGAVTVIRWMFYLVGAMLAFGAAWRLLSWAWKQMAPTTEKGEIDKARQRMRDMGY